MMKCDICQTVRTGKIVHHNTNIGHLSTYMSCCVLTCCLLCVKNVILILIETHLIKNKTLPHHASDSVVELSSIARKWSPLFFRRLTDVNKQASLQTILFTDDTMICSQHWEQVEENLEMCYYALLRSGMKVNRSKKEHMCK